jgi:uncharacterized protein (DUF779 family)
MNVSATDRAEQTVRMVADTGREDLVMVLGNGCCDSTAPYLYDHYYVAPDSREVGRVAGVPILAPGWLRTLYPDGKLTVDVDEGVTSDSFSLETALGRRFTLRLEASGAR